MLCLINSQGYGSYGDTLGFCCKYLYLSIHDLSRCDFAVRLYSKVSNVAKCVCSRVGENERQLHAVDHS